MNEIIDKLGESSVGDAYNSPNSSQFSHFYKSSPYINDQKNRRETLLNEQKRKRESLVDQFRHIVNNKNDPMEWSNTTSTQKKKTYYRDYQNRIMFSEWLIDVPEDFENNWLCLLCPTGHRTLLVANKENTEVYTKYGCLQAKFQSQLPSGSRRNFGGSTILDCVWNPDCKQYYVLDVIKWGGRDLTKCDTQFRFFWLQSKFEEISELGIASDRNKYPIQPLKYFNCKHQTLNELASSLHEFPVGSSINKKPKVDGILFYHKECSYEPGFTPLVGWLKMYMLSDILSVSSVHAEYLIEKPSDYTTLENHINESKKQKKNWWSVKRFNNNSNSDKSLDT